MKDIKNFAESIGIEFKNKNLIQTALTHRSYVNEHPRDAGEHNERLEFLGDAVLELVVTHYLFHEFPDKPEGELTAIRSAIVNTQSIYEASLMLSVNDYMRLSRGESKDTGKARQYILANAFEAIIGAVYLDQGYEKAEEFIAENLFHKVEGIVRNKEWRDAKSWVQERAQDIHGVTPTYKVLKEAGPDHDKNFTIGIYFGGELIARGEGTSKQEAEQDAARNALVAKKWM